MPAVTLKAHFDGQRILLDEPFDIPPNTELMVTVLASDESDRLTRLAGDRAGVPGAGLR